MKPRTHLIYWLILAALMFACVRCNAGDFTTEDKLEEITYQSLNAVDMLQTVYIARHPGAYREATSAFVIGEHPDAGKVYAYMAATAVAHASISYLLVREDAPVWLRRTWQIVTIAEKADCVGHNISVGIHVSF